MSIHKLIQRILHSPSCHNCELVPYNELPTPVPCPAGFVFLGIPPGKEWAAHSWPVSFPLPSFLYGNICVLVGRWPLSWVLFLSLLPGPFLYLSGTLSRMLGPACQIFVLSLLLIPGREGWAKADLSRTVSWSSQCRWADIYSGDFWLLSQNRGDRKQLTLIYNSM